MAACSLKGQLHVTISPEEFLYGARHICKAVMPASLSCCLLLPQLMSSITTTTITLSQSPESFEFCVFGESKNSKTPKLKISKLRSSRNIDFLKSSNSRVMLTTIISFTQTKKKGERRKEKKKISPKLHQTVQILIILQVLHLSFHLVIELLENSLALHHYPCL